jgi:TPP-dependent pyruvate/acetoin dehydrogenase alpha subunit
MALSQDDLLRMYGMMLLIRRFEEQGVQFFMSGDIRGSFHPCIGQEATAVGACAALRRDDTMTCTYRGHGQSIAKGLDPREAMAELLGRRTGCSKGKGGSMHYTDPNVGLLGENAIVAAGVPIAVGAALTAALDHTGRVALTFFGDGAVNQGVFHEALNLAAIWDLPVIFFCENNLYSEMTPIRTMVKQERLVDRICAYGIATKTVDGYDPVAVYETTLSAVEQARAGGGPTFIEAFTYRLVGHMVGDSEPYRTREEVAGWRERDPIVTFPKRLASEFGIDSERIADLDAKVAAEMAEIVRFARESPWPDPNEATEDVFA